MTEMCKSIYKLLATAPRGPSAIYRLDQGDYVRALASRRRYVSDLGESLDSDDAVYAAIWVDGFCWLEAAKEER